MDSREGAKHYLLIKRGSPDASGRELSALRSAECLLGCGIWPLWEHTRNRKAIKAGDQVGVYLAGSSQVVATANVRAVEHWTTELRRRYPLMLDGTPHAVVMLSDVKMLDPPIDVRSRLDRLSFIKPGVAKWGVAFMGGTRATSAADFSALTVGDSAAARKRSSKIARAGLC